MAAYLIAARAPGNIRARRRRSFKPYAVWGAQGILAAIFLFAGVSKFVMSAETLTEMYPLAFIRFIGACEVLGGLGLVLPGVFNVRRGLTPLAASGLVVIMIGAVVSTIVDMGVAPALFPFVIGVATAFVVYERRSWFSQSA